MLISRARSREGLTLIEVLVSMIILAIITTMLVMGWVNLQRASAHVVRTNNARASGRDAIHRVSNELRASQPMELPTPSGTSMSTPQPPLTQASPMSVTFYSAYNSAEANADGSGTEAVRPTRLRLDMDNLQSAPWNPACRTLYWERDANENGSFADSGDKSMVLARNVANETVADAIHGTPYTAVFMYAYRSGGDVLWTDNDGGTLDLSTIVAVRVRLIVDAKMGGAPKYIDTTTTVRLRNASGD